MFHHRRVVSLLLVLLLSILPIAPSTTARAEPRLQSAPAMTGSVLVALNQWRIGQGLWPLHPNATLDSLALEQATYLRSLGDALPTDHMHDGPDGSDPPARARRAGWPTYGSADFTAITEIGKIGPDAQDAMAFWTTSNIHLRSISNPVYREIGIAAVPHEFGFLTIVVLGARPDVLPAMVDGTARTLYLSNERYRGSSGFRYLTQATQVRLFDGSGRPLADDWTEWQPSLPLPADVSSPLVIAYSDGDRQTVAVVDLGEDRIDSSANSGIPLAVVAPSPVPQLPTPTPASVPLPTLAAQPATPQPIATRPAALLPVPAESANPPDTRIVYDARTLTVVNLSDTRQDWSGLELVQGQTRLRSLRWNNMGGFTMNAVPPRTCIIAIDPTLALSAAPPGFCTSYYAELELGASERFWATGTFEVWVNGQKVMTCPAESGLCEFALP